VQELLPRALEVRIDAETLPALEPAARPDGGTGRSPTELFAEYLTARNVADDAVAGLFNELYDEVVAT
jgi:exonuclease SbcD